MCLNIMRTILILTDDYRFFAKAKFKKPVSMEVDTLINMFSKKGYRALSKTITEIDWNADFSDTVVLYPSSEAAGLFYKGFIEDVLLRLQNKGTQLLPDFLYFRAHHNKVFMEFLRQDFKNEELKTIHSLCFGSVQGMMNFLTDNTKLADGSLLKEGVLDFPLVLKIAASTGSRGVFKVDSIEHLIKMVSKITPISVLDFQFTFYRASPFMQKTKNLVRKILGMKQVEYPIVSQKFLLQTFIANLPGDYRVLILGQKYYAFFRHNRTNDFRASGSGIFSFLELSDQVVKVLDFAKMAYEEINTPCVSLDIGFDGNTCHLLEFQCVSFSPFRREFSEGWFVKKDGEWLFNQGKSAIEEDYVAAIDYRLTSV